MGEHEEKIKMFKAITRITARVFSRHSLESYRALPGTYAICPPNLWHTQKIFFWGGVEFCIRTKMGPSRIRILHENGTSFKIDIWAKDVTLERVFMRVTGLTVNDLDDRVFKILSDVQKLDRWPSRCEISASEISALVNPTSQNSSSKAISTSR